MKKGFFLKSLISFILVAPLFIGCAPAGGDSSESIKPVDYNATFIESDVEVTSSKVEIYPGPSIMTSSNKCRFFVENQEVFVYETLVNYRRKFTWETPTDTAPVVLFDFEGKIHVEVEVNANEKVTTASISPLAYQIPITINGNKISFDLEYQTNYVLTYNDDYKTAIHIFTNEIEKDPITEEEAALDDSIVYIGPGLYKADTIPVKEGCTIYLAGGAYVYGDVHAEITDNITIKGHGIIAGDIYTRSGESDFTVPVVLRNAKHITIEDVTFLNPAGWVLNIYKCEDVTINNVKILSSRQNSDGISIQSCKDVTVTGGFVRSWDDSLVVKNNDSGSTENITFDGITVWTDLAQSMEVGYETHGPFMKDITFKNITVLHNFHKAVISMHNCDEANITNVKYENITVEDAAMFGDVQDDGENDFLIDFTIAYSQEWTSSGGVRGLINGVDVHNVKVYKEETLPNGEKSIQSRILGESADCSSKNVTIKGVEIEGRNIASAQSLKLVTNNHTSNINVVGEEVHGAEIALPYKLNLDESDRPQVTVHPAVHQDGILTPSFAWKTGERSFIGSKASTTGFTSTNTHGVGATNKAPADDGSGDFALAGHTASSTFDNNPLTYYQNGEWKNQTDEFAAITINFNRAITVGTLRIIGASDNKYYSEYSISVWALKDPSKNYVRLVGMKGYEMSPIVNNCIDINITAQAYYGIQLRLFRGNKITDAKMYQISEIEYDEPSLTINKPIVDSTENADVYTIDRVRDGDPTGTSYYESNSLPAYFVIDLGDLYSIKTFGLFLPPSLAWSARTQEIEILVSNSIVAYSKTTTEFTTAVERTAYIFDPATGNNNIIRLETPVQARFIKVVIYSNSDRGGYGGQLSEFTAYTE